MYANVNDNNNTAQKKYKKYIFGCNRSIDVRTKPLQKAKKNLPPPPVRGNLNRQGEIKLFNHFDRQHKSCPVNFRSESF